MRVTIQREDPCFQVAFGWAENGKSASKGQSQWKGLHAACHPANCVYRTRDVLRGIEWYHDSGSVSREISLYRSFISLYIYIHIPSSGILNRGHELEVNLNRGCRWNANYISPLLDLWFKCSGKKKDLCFIFHSTGKMEETGILR